MLKKLAALTALFIVAVTLGALTAGTATAGPPSQELDAWPTKPLKGVTYTIPVAAGNSATVELYCRTDGSSPNSLDVYTVEHRSITVPMPELAGALNCTATLLSPSGRVIDTEWFWLTD